MIHRTPFLLPLLYPSLLWRVNGKERALYLTFDDGPVPGPTEFALHTLSRFDAKATFFCIGDNVRKYPTVYKKILDDGHAVGNHTFNHLNGWRTDTATYLQNVEACRMMQAEQVLAACDETVDVYGNPIVEEKLFRPPYGKITRKQIQMLKGYKIVMWDVLSKDYSKHLSVESCLRNTVNACRQGSIVVFHDSYKAEKNMAYVLPRLLDHFASEGYAFKAIEI